MTVGSSIGGAGAGMAGHASASTCPNASAIDRLSCARTRSALTSATAGIRSCALVSALISGER